MNTDDIFKQSAKRQADLTAQQRRHALDEYKRQQEQDEKVQRNLAAINSRLQSALNYLGANEFPAVKQNGYDIQHHFRLSQTPTPSMQSYNRLDLYMSRGGVVHMMGGNPPHKSDYQLCFIGNEADGTIGVYMRAEGFTNLKEQLAPQTSASALSDSDVRKIFQSFLTHSMKCEEERIGKDPSPNCRNRVGTPAGF